MRRRHILAGLLLALAAPLVAEAQQAAKIARIGWLAGNLAAFPHMRRPSSKDCVISVTSRAATS
jgi:hypothetical protein